MIECFICGKKFNIPKYKPNAKFCSAECRISGNAKLSAKARGDTLRGRGQGKGYRKLNGRHEHRVIMEELLGRELLPNEVVHHLDGDKQNNDPSNLEVLSRSDHTRKHSTKDKSCGLSGCTNKHWCKGLCRPHYDQQRRCKR